MTTRIYHVSGPNGERLVRAHSRAQAIGHVVRDEYFAEVATQDSLIALIAAGAKVEETTAATDKATVGGIIDGEFDEVQPAKEAKHVHP